MRHALFFTAGMRRRCDFRLFISLFFISLFCIWLFLNGVANAQSLDGVVRIGIL